MRFSAPNLNSAKLISSFFFERSSQGDQMEFQLCIMVGRGEGESFILVPGKEYILGRHTENDMMIMDKWVSRNHFKIQVKQNRYFITDLYSKNGTFADGKDLCPGTATEVKEGVPIVIGMTVLGLGKMYQTCLKPFLDSIRFRSEVNEHGKSIVPRRAMTTRRIWSLFTTRTILLWKQRISS
jgi:hypothetical protein